MLTPLKEIFSKNVISNKWWKRISILIVIGLFCFLLYGFSKFGMVGYENELINNTISNLGSQNPITLHQAWDIMIEQAKKYDPNAMIVKLGSSGHSGDTASSGFDGKRLSWQGIAVSPDYEWWITISNASITNVTRKSRTINLLPIEKPVLDSPEAIALASQRKPELKPETDLGWGFHFDLTHISNDQALSPNPLVITIIGSYNRRTSLVSINASNGNLEQAKKQMFGGGGILYSWDAGKTWQASNLSNIFVTKVAKDLWSDQVAYAGATKGGHNLVYKTEDGGKSWQLWGTLPFTAEDWPFCIEVVGSDADSRKILVGTWTGLWSSTDGQTWSLLENLPEGPKQWMGQARSGKDYRLLVTITAGAHKGLYGSTDLSAWAKLSERTYRISESFDKKSILATDETVQDENSILKIDVTSKTPVHIPGKLLFAAGDFDGSFLAKDQTKGIGQLHDQVAAWDENIDPSGIDVSPEFQNDHTAVMVGFRSGLFRTVDGGKSWEKVISNLNQIVSGTNEAFDVKFLSKTSVVVVNSGRTTWEDF